MLRLRLSASVAPEIVHAKPCVSPSSLKASVASRSVLRPVDLSTIFQIGENSQQHPVVASAQLCRDGRLCKRATGHVSAIGRVRIGRGCLARN